jgi:hypothetical protein
MPASPGNYLSSAEGAQPLPRPWLRPRAPAALHRLLPYLALLPLLALLIVGANMALLTLWGQQPYRVDAGTYGDQLLLRNFYAQEANAAGETYRWSSNDSTIVVSGAALTPAVRARLLIGGTPADAGQSLPTELTVNGRNWGTFAVASTPRRYELLLPSDTGASLRLGLSSPLTRAPGEERALGVRLDAVELQLGAGPLLPLPLHLLAQLACLLLLIPICGALRLPHRATIGLLIAAALLLALLQAAALPLMGMYLPRLVGVCAALALLTTTALPFARRQLSWVAERDLRWLWGVMLLACLLRMLPMLYPPFATHDLPLNLKRLDAVTRGVLVLIAPSAEFAGEMTIYPPAPYVALLPTYLLLDSRPLVLQFGLALLDGTGALFVGLLALRLHAGSLAGRMAALLYAGSSIGFTVLWWGFTAQAFGQWFTAPLALLLIAAAKAGQVRTWLLAGLAFLVALLTHAGVAVLAVVWVTLVLGLLLIWARLPWRWWRGAAVLCRHGRVGLCAAVCRCVFVYDRRNARRRRNGGQRPFWRRNATVLERFAAGLYSRRASIRGCGLMALVGQADRMGAARSCARLGWHRAGVCGRRFAVWPDRAPLLFFATPGLRSRCLPAGRVKPPQPMAARLGLGAGGFVCAQRPAALVAGDR